MLPRNNPIHVPSHLRGDADPDTLAGLVRTSRRMGLFWPLLAVDAKGAAPSPHPGFKVSDRSAALVRELSDFGD
ncbi:hypothetical protein [Streptacidiphilus carbonis]|jgi:hypothetical protein|uniref:hypothetical protein n=1 Tax=Streptacidiphilus carbonis TaxID=105422 RepID=UPI0005AB2F63|nr:hypothetical protein [Streptacidiphilus carbonis]